VSAIHRGLADVDQTGCALAVLLEPALQDQGRRLRRRQPGLRAALRAPSSAGPETCRPRLAIRRRTDGAQLTYVDRSGADDATASRARAISAATPVSSSGEYGTASRR
jgi:hypothetical protein